MMKIGGAFIGNGHTSKCPAFAYKIHQILEVPILNLFYI